MCTGIHCIWGDRGARVYLLKGFNRVKGQCDVIFSRSFIGGHLWWGWGKVDSGTDHTTNNTFTARWLCPNFWHSYLFHDAFLYPLIINKFNMESNPHDPRLQINSDITVMLEEKQNMVKLSRTWKFGKESLACFVWRPWCSNLVNPLVFWIIIYNQLLYKAMNNNGFMTKWDRTSWNRKIQCYLDNPVTSGPQNSGCINKVAV